MCSDVLRIRKEMLPYFFFPLWDLAVHSVLKNKILQIVM